MKKRLQHWCFSLINAKFLRTTILQNIRERLLLRIYEFISGAAILRFSYSHENTYAGVSFK